MSIIGTAVRRPATYIGQAREALSFARAIAHYPTGLFERAITSGTRRGDHHDTPVILVHGCGHNQSAWYVVDRHLRRAGYTSVHTFNYNPLRQEVPQLAGKLAERIDLIRLITGAEKVHVVGHSMGGLILRWYVQELGGQERVDTAITIASPHEGTLLALPGRALSRLARQLAPDSPIIERLRHGSAPSDVRWIAYYSNLDLLVQPGSSAMLHASELDATNLLVKDHGHMSILLSRTLARSIASQLDAGARASAGAEHRLKMAA